MQNHLRHSIIYVMVSYSPILHNIADGAPLIITDFVHRDNNYEILTKFVTKAAYTFTIIVCGARKYIPITYTRTSCSPTSLHRRARNQVHPVQRPPSLPRPPSLLLSDTASCPSLPPSPLVGSCKSRTPSRSLASGLQSSQQLLHACS